MESLDRAVLAFAARPAVPLPPAARALTLLYLGVLAFHATRLTLAWLRAQTLRGQATVVRPAGGLAALVAECRAAFGLSGVACAASHRDVALLGAPAGLGPFTVGARRPAVLLPAGFLERSSPEEVRAVLGHELAHVERGDYAWNLVCEVLLLPIAFHPVTRWLRRRLAASREIACDELAVARLAAPLPYSRALLAAAAHLAGLPRPAQTLGVFDAGILEERMRQLIDHAHTIGPARARRRFAAALLVLIAAGSLSAAVAIEVKPRAARPEFAPFAGTWIGYLPGNTSPREPAVELDVTPPAASSSP